MKKKYKNARKILLNREIYEKDLLEKIVKIMKKEQISVKNWILLRKNLKIKSFCQTYKKKIYSQK